MNLQLFCDEFEQYLEDFSNEITNQSEELARIYDDFSIEKECENPDFVNMLGCGIPVKSAFEALHNDRLRTVSEMEVQRKLKSKLMRPQENGAYSGGTSGFRNSASNLTRRDRAEIAERVMKGEKIIF